MGFIAAGETDTGCQRRGGRGPCRRQGRGQSLVELALFLPVLLIIVMGVVDFSRVFYYHIAIVNAAQEGARLGSDRTKTDAQIMSAVQDEASVQGITITAGEITISPASSRTAGGSITVIVSYTFTPVTSIIPAMPTNLTIYGRATMPVA